MRQITSHSNEVIKQYKKAAQQRKYREQTGLFVIEGLRLVKDAASSGAVKSVITTFDALPFPVGEKVQVYQVPQALFRQICDTTSPQGIAALAQCQEADMQQMARDADFLLYCDRIQDPGNLGTMIRTADAAGCGGVILGEGCVDLYNPKTIRSTMASLFHVPVAKAEDGERCLKQLKEMGFQLVGTSLKESKTYYSVDFTRPTVFVLGNEAGGVDETLLNLCDKNVKIPLLGEAESLNVAIASAILTYELIRQRMAEKMEDE